MDRSDHLKVTFHQNLFIDYSTNFSSSLYWIDCAEDGLWRKAVEMAKQYLPLMKNDAFYAL